MADVLSKGDLFSPELVTDLFNKVRGKSSLAALSTETPVAFNGNEIFTFSMDDEVAIVGENGQKTAGELAVEPVKVVPIKVEYGHRVSDEFMYASEEKQIDILTAFNDGFAAKVARGIDIMAMHGVNPRTDEASSLIAQYFDKIENTVDYDEDRPDACLQEAISVIGDYDCTGMALSKTFASAMGSMRAGDSVNTLLYPDFAFGAQATSFYGTPCSVNSTVSFGSSSTLAIVGDFANAFRWGFAKEIPVEVIPYGDPDGTGKDLKNYNQCYIRAEAYIGWAILDEKAFALVKENE